jgi:hypothetical protein
MNAPQNTGARYLKRVERSFPSDYPAKQGKAMIRRKNLKSSDHKRTNSTRFIGLNKKDEPDCQNASGT